MSSLKNDKRKRENVTLEVKECSRRKAQNDQPKNLQKRLLQTNTFTIIAMKFIPEQLIR